MHQQHLHLSHKTFDAWMGAANPIEPMIQLARRDGGRADHTPKWQDFPEPLAKAAI